jgi:hypothetical protein
MIVLEGTLYVISNADFKIPYQINEKSQKCKLKFVGILFLRSTTFFKG